MKRVALFLSALALVVGGMAAVGAGTAGAAPNSQHSSGDGWDW